MSSSLIVDDDELLPPELPDFENEDQSMLPETLERTETIVPQEVRKLVSQPKNDKNLNDSIVQEQPIATPTVEPAQSSTLKDFFRTVLFYALSLQQIFWNETSYERKLYLIIFLVALIARLFS